jgi:hypothetical protein
MKKCGPLLKNLLTILCLFIVNFVPGQQTGKTKLKVYVEKNPVGHAQLPYSDTLTIQFDGGFKNDAVKIKTGDKCFITDTLSTDGSIGYAGKLKIPKAKGSMKIMVYLNDQYIGKLKVNKKFSEAHINLGIDRLTWTFIYYFFIYL